MSHNRTNFILGKLFRALLGCILWLFVALAVAGIYFGVSRQLDEGVSGAILSGFAFVITLVLLWRIYVRFQLSLDSAKDWWAAYNNHVE